MTDFEIPWSHIEGTAFLPASDPLWRRVSLPLASRYAVYGAPLNVTTNAPILADLAREVFGHWGCPTNTASEPDLDLRLILHSVPERETGDRPLPLLRAQEGYLWISSGSSFGFADRPAGFATAFVTPAALAEPEMLKSRFIECLGVYLACGRRTGTLHAAGVQCGARGVLLTGPGGAGKSTLAYACLRAGWRLLAEDLVVVETRKEGRVGAEEPTAWGDARSIHLLSDALRFFPELADAPCVRQLNGEMKLKVQVSALRPEATVAEMPVRGICSLGRANGSAARLRPADPGRLRAALTRFKGDPPVDHAAMNRCVDALLAGRAAHLEVGSDLNDAVAVLRKWISE